MRQTGFGVKLEVLVPLPGKTSQTVSIAESVIWGGIVQLTGAQDLTMMVQKGYERGGH